MDYFKASGRPLRIRPGSLNFYRLLRALLVAKFVRKMEGAIHPNYPFFRVAEQKHVALTDNN
jgi:hypothetical protein